MIRDVELSFHGIDYVVNCVSSKERLALVIEEKETGRRWKNDFSANAIESITQKTGSAKKFEVFVQMMESALSKRSDSVCVDILTYDDLVHLRSRRSRSRGGRDDTTVNRTKSGEGKGAGRRYLILTYAAEFDRVCYPLPLAAEIEPDSAALRRTILRLRMELDNHRESVKENIRLKKLLSDAEPGSNASLRREYNELQIAHERLVRESEATVDELRRENQRLREELSEAQCQDARNDSGDQDQRDESYLELKRRLRATEQTLRQEQRAHEMTRETNAKLERSLRRNLQKQPKRSNGMGPSKRAKRRGSSRASRRTATTNRSRPWRANSASRRRRRVRSASPCVYKNNRFDPTAYAQMKRQRRREIESRRTEQIESAMTRRGRSRTRRGRSVSSTGRSVVASVGAASGANDSTRRPRSKQRRRRSTSARRSVVDGTTTSVRDKSPVVKAKRDVPKRAKSASTSVAARRRRAARQRTSKVTSRRSTSRRRSKKTERSPSVDVSRRRSRRSSRTRRRRGDNEENRNVDASLPKKMPSNRAEEKRSVLSHWINVNNPGVRLTPRDTKRSAKKTPPRSTRTDKSIAMSSFSMSANIHEIDERLDKLQSFLQAAKRGEDISDLPRA